MSLPRNTLRTRFRAIVAVLMFGIAVAAAPTALAAEASSGPTERPDPTQAASNPLSDAATSGLFLYRRHCQSCHGNFGSGTDKLAPLLGTKYSLDHGARREFHRQFRQASRDHIKVARGTRKNPGPRFNQIELIGKFLREMEAWYAILDRTTEN